MDPLFFANKKTLNFSNLELMTDRLVVRRIQRRKRTSPTWSVKRTSWRTTVKRWRPIPSRRVGPSPASTSLGTEPFFCFFCCAKRFFFIKKKTCNCFKKAQDKVRITIVSKTYVFLWTFFFFKKELGITLKTCCKCIWLCRLNHQAKSWEQVSWQRTTHGFFGHCTEVLPSTDSSCSGQTWLWKFHLKYFGKWIWYVRWFYMLIGVHILFWILFYFSSFLGMMIRCLPNILQMV